MYTIFNEFVGLFVGSDHLADEIMGRFFPNLAALCDGEHRDISNNELTGMTRSCCKNLILRQQPVLDFNWRSTLLSDLLTLAAAGLLPPFRRVRGNLDFLTFQQNTGALESNTEVYLHFAADIAAKAAELRRLPDRPHHAAATPATKRGSTLACLRAQAQRMALMHLAKMHFSVRLPAALPMSAHALHFQRIVLSRTTFHQI